MDGDLRAPSASEQSAESNAIDKEADDDDAAGDVDIDCAGASAVGKATAVVDAIGIADDGQTDAITPDFAAAAEESEGADNISECMVVLLFLRTANPNKLVSKNTKAAREGGFVYQMIEARRSLIERSVKARGLCDGADHLCPQK